MEAAPGIAEFAVIAIMILFMAFGVLLVVLPFWKICTKAGLPGPLALLMIVPIANIVLPFYIAFTDWPALRNTATPPDGGLSWCCRWCGRSEPPALAERRRGGPL